MTGSALIFRSLAFNAGFYVGTAVIALLGAPILLLPRAAVVKWSHVWVAFAQWWLRLTIGLDHRVSGLGNLPQGPAIIASKHQSSWETLAFARLFPGSAIVLKRELLFIPIVGWAMARAGNIAVARGEGASALRGLLRQARRAVAEGRSIMIFPEGTRVAVGADRPYQIGVAALYRQLGVPVVPVALNSGLYWPRRRFLKQPGTITVEILPALPPGLDRAAFMTTLKERIEGATQALADSEQKVNKSVDMYHSAA